MRHTAAVLLFLVACGVDRGGGKQPPQNASTTTAEPAAGTYVLGSSVTPEGAIDESAAGESFVHGGPIFLSIDVSGATTAERIEVEWIDARGRVVHRDERVVPQGTGYAAFSAGRTAHWPPGAYRVVVIIDGRRVNEQPFSIG